MANDKIVSEYEAASITGMSPELLKWLTTHSPKHGIKRKLKHAKIKDDTYFYSKEELLSFNSWLKLPWPRKDGARPNIPAAIKREIKNEANGQCAICQGHKDSCEAAHIEPVSATDNNHPENLIYLCSNHHTTYDKGFFGPGEVKCRICRGLQISASPPKSNAVANAARSQLQTVYSPGELQRAL